MVKDLKWTGPKTYVDGLPYGRNDHAGYEVEVNATGSFAVPAPWSDDGKYSFPLKDLPGLQQGDNAVRLRTVAANGQVSDWTSVVTFPYFSVPRTPESVAVA
jgi:hypothetical protein